VERVEHGEQLVDERLGGTLEVLGLLLQYPLLVVLEVGLDALRQLSVLVTFARQLPEVGGDGLLGRLHRLVDAGFGGNDLVRLSGRDVVGHQAPCSSTISASTTSSSAGVDDPAAPSSPALA